MINPLLPVSVLVAAISVLTALILYRSYRNQERIARELREAREMSRMLVEESKDYAIFMLDPQGYVRTWNAGAERITGYRAEEVIGREWAIFYTPEDAAAGKPLRNLEEAANRGRCADEGWRVRKDGSKIWVDAVIAALRDPGRRLLGFSKITRDLTGRRQMEEALKKANEDLESRVKERTEQLARINDDLAAENRERERAEGKLVETVEQLRILAARLDKVREDERAAIAREVHDELGQALTAIKMDLFFVLQKLPSLDLQNRARLESTVKLVDGTIQSVRRIARQLRPGLLDDLGLGAAIEWEAEEFQKRTGITCQVTVPEDNFIEDDNRSIALFRIFQEALTNVARHSGATHVAGHLRREGGCVTLEVYDNGRGFREDAAPRGATLGLVVMRERAQLLGGEFTIKSAAGEGTSVIVTIPLAP